MNKVLDTKLFTARDVCNIIKDNLYDILTRLGVNCSDRTFNCSIEVVLDNVEQQLIKTAEATVSAMKSGCTEDRTNTTWEMTD